MRNLITVICILGFTNFSYGQKNCEKLAEVLENLHANCPDLKLKPTDLKVESRSATFSFYQNDEDSESALSDKTEQGVSLFIHFLEVQKKTFKRVKKDKKKLELNLLEFREQYVIAEGCNRLDLNSSFIFRVNEERDLLSLF